MSEMSPERQELLKNVVDVQEKQLNGCLDIFRELMKSSDDYISDISTMAFDALENTRDVLDAMIDRLNATIH